jgi:hypothetical protein
LRLEDNRKQTIGRGFMGEKIALLMGIGILAIGGILALGCPSHKVTRHETAAYQSASPENKLKIEQGKIDVGMSIEECKASCPECQFVRKFTNNKDYEVWEVTGPGKDLYLHVQNGRIEKVSVNVPHPSRHIFGH